MRLALRRRQGRNLGHVETRSESDVTFVIGNIVPGKYWLVTRQNDERENTGVKSIRRNSDLRSMVLRDAEKLKKEIALKPSERVTDYELALTLAETHP